MASSEQRLQSDASFERLYRRHRRDVYGAVLRDVRDPSEAEDVTQIAFLNAFRAIRRGEEPAKPRAWLVTIARNVVRRRYRTLQHRPQEVALDPEIAADLVDVDGPTAGEIATAIRRLPANQRAVILLREIQGRSYAEIATELGLSLAAVETLIFRARRSLSEELQLADHIPATRPRRSLRGLLALPLPGFGKLGFSLSRAGVAAFVGGVAIVTVPVTDSGADSQAPPAVQRGPLVAEASGPPVGYEVATDPRLKAQVPAERPDGTKARPHRRLAGGGAKAEKDALDALTVLPPLPVPTVDLPSTDDVALPPLPIEPPVLPPPPPLPDLPPVPT